MALSVFSITVPEPKVLADRDSRRATFSLDVKNESAAAERVVVTVRPDASAGSGVLPADPAWFGAIQQLVLPSGVSQPVPMTAAIPAPVAAGTYGFVPVAYSADRDPEETAVTGPSMSLVLPAPVPPVPWWRRWWPWWLVAVVAVLVLAVAAVVVVRALTDDRVELPRVAGRPAAQAVQTLRALGLEVIQRGQPSERPVDTAVGTEPAAGTRVPAGSRVTLVVDLADTRVPVPRLGGQTADQARQTLQGLGLQVTQREEESDEAVGTVLGTEPGAGSKVPPGSQVTLVVARARTVEVPRLLNLRLVDAEAQLTQGGLTFEVSGPGVIIPGTTDCRLNPFFPPVPCVVRAQDPAGGQRVPLGTSVSLRVFPE
jgi:PASTA domain